MLRALPGGSAKTPLASGFNRIDDVEIDPVDGKLYWNNWRSGSPSATEGIYRAELDGTGVVQFTAGPQSNSSSGHASGMHGISIDPVGRTLYFTRGVSYADGNGGPEVSRIGLDGSGYTRLNAANDGWFLSGVVVDTDAETLYWGSPGVLNTTLGGAVNRMATDGTNRQYNMVPHTDGRGRSLALDPHARILFFSSWAIVNPASGGGIWALDLDGGTVTQVLNDPGTGIPDVEIDLIDRQIYWTDFARGMIWKANYDGSNRSPVLSGLRNPFGLALSICGDGNPEAFEDCDAGEDNGTTASCCSGSCTFEAEGETCDDADACSQTDRCDGEGTCLGEDPVVCTALDQCHEPGTCDPATGTCSDPEKADGSACDDTDVCSLDDTCQAGACEPGEPTLLNPLADPAQTLLCLEQTVTQTLP